MTDQITGWHAHVYYSAGERAAAEQLCEAAKARFGIEMGRMHDGPVGPHPRGSCQLSVPAAAFAGVIPWLALNRAGLTVFIHAETGDPVADHRDHVLWLGASEAVDVGFIERYVAEKRANDR